MAGYKDVKLTGFIDGNTARQLNSAPVRKPEPIKVPVRQPGKRKKKSNATGFVSFFVMAVAITLFACIGYLSCQANNRSLASDIKSLEKEIGTVTSMNDATEYAIYNNMELNYIIEVATTELGMVKLTESNIEYYGSTPNEYINQYKNIPD